MKTSAVVRTSLALLIGIAASFGAEPASAKAPRPRLQIISGSARPGDIFRLKTALACDETTSASGHEAREIEGWTVNVSRKLLAQDAAATARALELIRAQLAEIVRVVPAPAVSELRKVPLWISPEYPGVRPKAEYHPDAGWLRAHGCDPAMARSVEFTNVRIFDAEVRRMPVLVLHELAHAYHHRVLGHDHAGIKSAYEQAKAGGTYDRVERQDSEGRKRLDRAYALTNPQEYFAESTEAFFGRNDFFPCTRDELKRHDPAVFALLEILWNKPAASGAPR